MVYFRFSKKKKRIIRIIKRQGKYFLINEVDQIVKVPTSVFEFNVGDKTCKNNLCGSRKEVKRAIGRCVRRCGCAVREDERITCRDNEG